MKKFRRRARQKNKCIIFALLSLGLLILFDMQLHPLVKTVSQTAAKRVCIEAINTAVMQTLSDEADAYSELVAITKDDGGTVTSIQTDSVEMNRLKAALSLAIEKKISSADTREINIPLGTVIGGELLSGRGPKINLIVDLAGNVLTELESVFEAAGINQTCHKIMLHVKCDIYIVMPCYTTSSTLETDFCIAETVIVGKVPETYAGVNLSADSLLPRANADDLISQK